MCRCKTGNIPTLKVPTNPWANQLWLFFFDATVFSLASWGNRLNGKTMLGQELQYYTFHSKMFATIWTKLGLGVKNVHIKTRYCRHFHFSINLNDFLSCSCKFKAPLEFYVQEGS
jgi:hypothetical protein